MTTKKVDVKAAEQRLKEAIDNAKRLKAKSREAKLQLKQAKKAAKRASKAARAARKESDDARRVHKKAVARADKAAKAPKPKKDGAARRTRRAKSLPAIVTPRKTSAGRLSARRPRSEPAATPAGVDFEVAFTDHDLKTLEPH